VTYLKCSDFPVSVYIEYWYSITNFGLLHMLDAIKREIAL